jgi:predicted transcriptional regulator
MKIPNKRKEDYQEEDDRIICKICGGKFSHLGSHLWHKHRIKAKTYKETFGLPYNFSLISRTVYEKKSRAFQENREFFLENFRKAGTKYQFKKGMKMPKSQYRSERQVRKTIANINKVNAKNKFEECPVCHQRFKSLASHLYNKHKLVQVLVLE